MKSKIQTYREEVLKEIESMKPKREDLRYHTYNAIINNELTTIDKMIELFKEEIEEFVEEHINDGKSKDYCFYALKGKFVKEKLEVKDDE